MEQKFVTPVQGVSKLQLAITSSPLAIQVDLPEDIDPLKYFMVLSSRIAGDIQVMTSRVRAFNDATITLTDHHSTLMGDEMSERIAKIEVSIQHLSATLAAMDAKIDKIIETTSDIRAGNAAMVENFVEYDRKLDKKPSKDEVAKLISDARNTQTLWCIGTLVALSVALYKIISK